MHGTSQGVPIPLTTMGGLATLAGPESLPEGASPRCYDVDFGVGSVRTRDGLTSVYTYAGSSLGPSGGGSASDRPVGGTVWAGVGNVLVDTGVYATCALTSSGSDVSSGATGSSIGGGAPWSNPGNVSSGVAFASVSLSAGGSTYSPSASAGSVSNSAGPSNQNPAPQTTVLSGFASVPATSATLYVAISGQLNQTQGGGSIQLDYSTNSGASWNPARSWGAGFNTTTVSIPLTGIANLNSVRIRVTAACGCGPSGFANVSATVSNWYATTTGSVQLNAQTLEAAITGLAIPAGAVITGLGLSFGAYYSGTAPSFTLRLNVGSLQPSFTLTTAAASYTAGGPGQLWGYGSWDASALAALKVDFTVSTASTATVNVNALAVTVYYTDAALDSDAIDVTQFGFSAASSSTPLGFQATVEAFASAAGATLTVQMLKGGAPVGTAYSVALSTSLETFTLGGPTDLWGAQWSYADLNNTAFGIEITAQSTAGATISVGYATLGAYIAPHSANFNFITTFTDLDGTVRNLSLDASGNLWVENVTGAPGILNLARQNIAAGAYAVGAQGEGVEYLAFNDGMQGIDIPLQYTAKWIDRITQVGPGAPPVFTPIVGASNTFPVSGITQPLQKSDPAIPGHFETIQWSQGPTSTAAGNVVTIFYANANSYPQDSTLADAFNSGQAVYVYMSTLPSPYVNGTYQVTSVGKAVPPGGSAPRWYFTYQVTTSAYNQIGGPGTGTGFYQQTLATLNTGAAVPGLTVGSQVTITGVTPANWNNTWTVSQALNSGAMAITQTAVAGGVATFSYSLSTGTAPAVGQLVTITGTNNANGGLNLVNVPIVSASGGPSGTFTVNVSLPDYAASAEQGQATTAGTKFAFDPGLATLGSATSPIYGNGGAGSLTFSGTGQFIGSGTRQGTVFFITRNGYWTAPAPPVTFTVPSNCTAISATQIPIGPPNVIARGIAFTEAGQNGVPGANFFTIPTDVDFTVQNVSYTANSLIINDNTTTQAQFFFTDQVLLSAEAIDIYGYNLFNQIEIGNPGWVVGYSSRNFYGLCQNKVQNFNNLSFDGGYLVPTNPLPLGWTVPDAYGRLNVSPVFGDSYYIRNTSGGTLPVAGSISQAADKDAYQQPILSANTAYSVRVTARCPSGNPAGSLVIALTASGITYGSYTLPFSAMTSSMATYTGTLLTAPFVTVPEGLQLTVSASGAGSGADVEIDRFDVFPTGIPVLWTTVYGSYAGLPEQVDGVTGQGKFVSENQQPVNGAVVMYDTLYCLKGSGPFASMYSWQASPNLEPSDWNEPEVAQRAGACGPMAFDFGEQWIVCACRNGVYLYEGGQPGKIMQEIFQVWDAVNWAAETTIWVRNDVTNRRLLLGLPMATPNFWLPNTPPSTQTLGIAHVTISPYHVPPHPRDAHVTLTFTQTAPVILPGQTYVLAGLTAAPSLNGMELAAQSVSGNTATFVVPGAFFPFDSAETGTAVVSPVMPVSPNVILVCNYQGLDSGSEIKSEPMMHTTMFGTLNAIDMRRKWSLWQIASPYGATVETATSGTHNDNKDFYICNGNASSKVYRLDAEGTTDDGLAIDSLYTTFGFPGDTQRKQSPALNGNVRVGYMGMTVSGVGNMQARFLPNTLLGPGQSQAGYNPWTVPGGFNLDPQPLWNMGGSVNLLCTRAFVELRSAQFNLSMLTIVLRPDAWNKAWVKK